MILRISVSNVLKMFLYNKHNCFIGCTFVNFHPHSLLAGSPVGLRSKRFVFEILLARENRVHLVVVDLLSLRQAGRANAPPIFWAGS